MADIEEPADLGRIRHLTAQMHKSEDDAGDPIPDGYLLAADGARGHTWTDPAGITGSTDAADINVLDSAGYFTGTNVETVLAELAAKVLGYQAHGSLGSTETFNAATAGWHSGTLNADCTFTFSGATSGILASMVLELTQDGTGGWALTLPGSVVGDFSGYDTTAGTTSLLMFFSRDGGTTWFGFIAGGGTTVGALDDLSDVILTTPAADDTLRFDGSDWINDNRRWEPVTFDPGTGPEIVFDPTDVVMTWKAY